MSTRPRLARDATAKITVRRSAIGASPNLLRPHVTRFHANFSYQAGSWTKPRRVIAKVEWHPGELYPRVGFIVTNMSRPAERVVAFYNITSAGRASSGSKKARARSSGRGCRAGRLPQTRCGFSFMSCLQPLATPEPLWSLSSLKEKLIKIGAKVISQGHQPRPQHCLPDGRGRNPTADDPGDFATYCGTAAAAAVGTGMRRPIFMHQRQPTGGARPNATQNGRCYAGSRLANC